MTAQGIFVTGTDTGVGKTVAACALLRGLVAAGHRAVGMKPVAAGIAQGTAENDDVTALARAGNVDAPRADRNPCALALPLAPHLAARRAGTPIDVDAIVAAYARLADCADVVVVEGAGGVLVPLDARRDMLDLPRALDLPVLLVVGLRLGCINHALLSALAIRARGLELAGWIACAIDPAMDAVEDNLGALDARLAAPRIATLGHGQLATALSPAALAAAGVRARPLP